MKFSPFWPNGFSSYCSQNKCVPLSGRNWGVVLYPLRRMWRAQVLCVWHELFLSGLMGCQSLHWRFANRGQRLSIGLGESPSCCCASQFSPTRISPFIELDCSIYWTTSTAVGGMVMVMMMSRCILSFPHKHTEKKKNKNKNKHTANQRTATDIVILNDNQYCRVCVYVCNLMNSRMYGHVFNVIHPEPLCWV